MKTLILGIGLVALIAISLGCDENNNVIAQEPEPMEPGPMTEAMTMVTGKVIDSGDQCDGMIDGFAVGDEISITMNGGNFNEGTMPSGKVENMTSGNSVDCGGDEAVFDSPPVSVLVCESENSQISSFKNGDFMTMLVDFSWIQSFLDNIEKSAYVINQNIDFVDNQDLKKAPCARVMIETLTVAGP